MDSPVHLDPASCADGRGLETAQHHRGAMSRTRHNKQHDARAASFRRIAKDLRKVGKEWVAMRYFIGGIARAFDAEAKRLRAMR